MSIASELDECWQEALDMNAEARGGKRSYCIVRGVKRDCLVFQSGEGLIPVSSGKANSADFRLMLAIKDFPVDGWKKYEPITFCPQPGLMPEVTEKFYQYNIIGTYAEIIFGDPATESN